MFTLSSSLEFFLYNSPTDMRKSFDGLCGLVQGQLQRNPMSGEVFIFVNRKRDRVKLLHWENGGFVLYYKRLESGTLEVPFSNHTAISYQMQWRDLIFMIDGISYKNIKKRKRFLFTN